MRVTMIEYENTNKVQKLKIPNQIYFTAKPLSGQTGLYKQIQLDCVLQTTYCVVHLSLQIETNGVCWIQGNGQLNAESNCGINLDAVYFLHATLEM